jgi:hypothetical protein
VVGSDQVWNLNFFGEHQFRYFLDFVDNPDCKKISYGACFGALNQPEDLLSRTIPLLKGFRFLSVRNRMSANLVNSLCGITPQVVLDPSAIYDYEEFLNQSKTQQDYIFAYFLSHKNMELGVEILQNAAERLKLPALVLGDYTYPDKKLSLDRSAGPIEWLKAIYNSSFVITNSFHGTIFAVKFKKPFIAWGGHRPQRIKDFLSLCGLEHRLFTEMSSYSIEHLLFQPINYAEVHTRLSSEIKNSLEFLRYALS